MVWPSAPPSAAVQTVLRERRLDTLTEFDLFQYSYVFLSI
jgi:hypothetical protein